jgi:hypothetical protein
MFDLFYSRIPKTSASLFCSVGLSGLSGFLVERNKSDEPHQPDKPDRTGVFQACRPSMSFCTEEPSMKWTVRAGLV